MTAMIVKADGTIEAHMHHPDEYLAIRWWHSGSAEYYIEKLQWEACFADAPLMSIYRQHSGARLWITLDGLIQEHKNKFQDYLDNNPLAIKIQKKYGKQYVA